MIKKLLFVSLMCLGLSAAKADPGYVYGSVFTGPLAGNLIFMYTGPNLDYSGGYLNAVNANWNATSGNPGYIVGKPNISTVGQSGNYSDLLGIPTTFTPASHNHVAADIGDSTTVGRAVLTASTASDARAALGITSTAPRVKTSVTKSIGTCFQLSSTRDAHVTYNVEIQSASNLTGGARGTLYLETFTDSSCTTGTEEVMRSTSGNTMGLGVSIGNTVIQTLNVNGYIMAGQYAKLRTVNDVGTPTFTARPGQEVLQ
jgi:hypothetical protein